jgi:predicted dehydrogenase
VSLVFPSPYLRHFPTPLVVERMDGSEHVEERRTVSYEEAFRAELDAFRQCVREGKKPETSIEDALGDARRIQAIARAMASPRPERRPSSPRATGRATHHRSRAASRRR